MANLWTVSLDDSGDQRKAIFIIAGCLVGNKAEWNSFHKAWRKELHKSPRIEHFHQKEYAALIGEFRQFCDEHKWPKPSGRDAAIAKRKALIDVIGKSPISCYALALRIDDYNRVRNGSTKARRYLDKDPWLYLIQELAFDTATQIVEYDSKAHIAFLAGPHEKKAQYETFYEGFKKKNPIIANHLLGMTHGDFRKIYPLQAADLIASEAKRCWEGADRNETPEEVFKRHPILTHFIGFKTIHEERLKGVIEVQGTKHK